jgi:hypothetical protein
MTKSEMPSNQTDAFALAVVYGCARIYAPVWLGMIWMIRQPPCGAS